MKTKSVKNLLNILYILILIIGAYYVLTRAFSMVVPSQESYGDYYFSRVNVLLPHIILGIIAIIIGPFQFIPSFRNKNIHRHRLLGRIYLVCVVLGGITGMYLALTSQVNLGYKFGLMAMSFFWASTGLMAFFSIKKRKIELHKEWMLRSYTITFTAFVFTRLIIDVLQPLEIAEPVDIFALSVWSSWVIPLLILEMVIQGKKMYS
ncbi:MAG: DUF2306 domain-containing protein [Balneolaceae bacterium]|nr:DUF2306 domain-containing protein [Balneolaceae bacterium]